ncbi:IS1096 element passenger TnpR family protein [uncultured Adlercreutzia sp.]|uniref:IS1096 element passenger TnpR family protein n=1 Tax=uncultured Adlercreutzia sp. TaxID=875803 RepID=UPI0025F38DA2|nr:hypothetical protein [uncultured Adlercreutzia sp.]MCI9261229.1 plasmid pRiA4b ORF-3 family protein [Eggerthellaceae bacterium]
MAAKIIKFPTDPSRGTNGTPRDEEDARSYLNVIIELVDTEPSLLRNASVRPDDSLADLHRVITELFGWNDAHNYFFSQGSCRYEDPSLFISQDRLSARCRKIYCADEVPVGRVLEQADKPLFYAYNLVNPWELRIHLDGRAVFESVAQEG